MSWPPEWPGFGEKKNPQRQRILETCFRNTSYFWLHAFILNIYSFLFLIHYWHSRSPLLLTMQINNCMESSTASFSLNSSLPSSKVPVMWNTLCIVLVPRKKVSKIFKWLSQVAVIINIKRPYKCRYQLTFNYWCFSTLTVRIFFEFFCEFSTIKPVLLGVEGSMLDESCVNLLPV